MNKKIISLLILGVSLTGCVSYQTHNAVVNTKQLPNLNTICIQENLEIDPKKEYLTIIANRFEANGVKTQIYSAQKPAECRYSLTYEIKRNWDVVPFVSKASLHLFDHSLQIHTAQYKVNSTFELDKWKNSQDKIEPLVDQLTQK